MAIEFRCTSCEKLLRVADDTAGKQAKCPQCGAVVSIPAPPSEVPPPADAVGSAAPFAFGSPGTPAAEPSLFPSASRPADSGVVNPYQTPASYQAPTLAVSAGEIRPTKLDLMAVLNRAWEIYQSQMGMCIAVVLVCIVINYIAQMIGSALNMMAQMTNEIAVVIAVQTVSFIIVTIFQTWLQLGQLRFFLKTARGQKAEFTDVFSGGPHLVPALIAFFLIWLAILGILAVCAVPAGIIYAATQEQDPTVLAGVVGGVIAALVVMYFGLMFSQFQLAIVDREVGALESLRLSRLITAGNKGWLFVLFLFIGVVNLVGFAACCVGLIFTVPYAVMSMTVAYLWMTGQPLAQRQAWTPPVPPPMPMQ